MIERRTIYSLCTFLFVLVSANAIVAQRGFELELKKEFLSPAEGPKISGYTGSIIYNINPSVSFSVTAGMLKRESASVFMRDYKNTNLDYDADSEFTIIPIIGGARYTMERFAIFEPFLEADLGMNILIIENQIIKNNFTKKWEILKIRIS